MLLNSLNYNISYPYFLKLFFYLSLLEFYFHYLFITFSCANFDRVKMLELKKKLKF